MAQPPRPPARRRPQPAAPGDRSLVVQRSHGIPLCCADARCEDRKDQILHSSLALCFLRLARNVSGIGNKWELVRYWPVRSTQVCMGSHHACKVRSMSRFQPNQLVRRSLIDALIAPAVHSRATPLPCRRSDSPQGTPASVRFAGRRFVHLPSAIITIPVGCTCGNNSWPNTIELP